MADREIRLVGVFQDGITSKLKKLNAEINRVTQSFTKMQGKLRPIAKEMGVLAMASERVAKAMQSQRSAMESSIRTMQQVRRETGALNRANRSVTARINTQKASIDSSVRAMNQYRTAVGKVVAAQKRLKPTVLPPASALPRGGGGVAPPPRRRAGGGGGLEAGVFGAVFGSQIGNVMTDAIYRGFQMGTQLMMKPFQYFAGAFAERIGDELADIQSAGGIFASDKKFGTKLFRDFGEARQYQEKLNQRLAKSAAALPGATSDYVRTARQLTDTISLAFSKNQKSFNEYAKELGGTGEAMDSMAVVLQKFTEKGVLLGQGQRGGIPLPVLLEQLVNRQQVNVQGLKARFVALRDNPLLSAALEDAQAEINKTGVGTAERIKAVMKALDAALPNEVISAMKRSLAGVQEAVGSAFIDPDTGLFGLSRELAVTVPRIDEFGRYIKKNGEVAGRAAEAAQESTSIFKILRDTLAGFVIPLSELISFLPQIFDPLAGVAEAFKGLRERANFFYNRFMVYTKFFEEEDARLLKAGKKGFKGSMGARGALAAINKLLESIGAISPEAKKATALALEDPTKGIGEIAKQLLTQLFNSDIMREIGQAIGSAIGSVLSSLATILGGAKDMASAGPFAKGFSDGFKAAGGDKAIVTIFKSIFGLMGKGLLEIFKAAPFETSVVAGLLLFGPAIAGAVGTAIVGAIPQLMGKALKGGVPGMLGKAARAAKAATAVPAGAVAGLMNKGGFLSFLGGAGGKNFIAGLKAVSPKLLAFGGVLSAIIALFEGKGLTEALAAGLGSAGGTAIGAAIGTVIFPGIGTALGAAIGGWVGSLEIVTQPLTSALNGLFGAIEPLGGLLGQLWNDVTGVVNGVITKFMDLIGLGDKLGEGFNLLQFALFALLSPFKLLQIGIMGIYEAYLEVKRRIFGLGAEEKAAYNRTVAGRQKATDEFTIEGRQASGFSLQQQKAAEYAKFQAAKKAGNTAEMNRITQYMRVIDQKLSGQPARTVPSQAARAAAPRAAAPRAAAPAAAARPAGGAQASPVPALQALNVKQSGANALLNQVKIAAQQTKSQIAASSNAQQARVREVTAAVNRMNAKLSAGMPVKVVNQPTVKFAMGGMGPIGGGIGKFPKTSGYGMRWGKMHTGNDYGMPVGTKLGIGGPGTVLGAGNWGGYGLAMDIGGPGGMVYRFAHLSKFLAPVGAQLPPGMPFALSGNTGRSTGPHLHFEARPGGAGPVPPDAYAGIIRAGFAGTPIGGILSAAQLEASKMPYGAQLAIGNSDEIFMKPTQLSTLVEGSTRAGVNGAGNFEVGKVEVTINDNTGDIAKVSDRAAEMILQSMYRQSRSEVLTS